MKSLTPELGKRLFELLPEVYRERDNSDRNLNRGSRDRYNGDLGRYLAACGELLDALYHTLEQRLADAFPDIPHEGRVCQDWVLPYFADLVDVRLVSPDVNGRREELANAISWRQRKGTLTAIEEIAQAVGQMEVEVQEGWRRVATTPRIGMPLLSARTYGYASEPDMHTAGLAARHPGLSAVTVDFRCPSRALQTDAANPAAHTTRFNGVPYTWRQASRNGVPCFPGSYEDVSRRIVDMRTPDWNRGHVHPRRVALYMPPAAGFFPIGAKIMPWEERAAPRFAAIFAEMVVTRNGEQVRVFRNKTLGTANFTPIKIRGFIEFKDVATFRFEGLQFDGTLEVESGRLELYECAVRNVEVHTIGTAQPVFTATHSLMKTVQNARGLSRLEYCTVLQETLTEALQASDCIFLGKLRRHHAPSPPPTGCVRYSRVVRGQALSSLSVFRVTRDPVVMYTRVFGRRGCGVLHPATTATVRFGAEDAGEMGAYHRRAYALRETAVLDKLKDYLPVGVEAVLIPDTRLNEFPLERQ